MRSLPTAVTAATAAALAALAMTVTVSAIGDDVSPGRADNSSGPDPATVRACLTDHGVTAPDGDGRALKEWVSADRTAAEKEALKACGIDPDIKPTQHERGGTAGPDGPDEATLRACLKDHGANVPTGDDGGALKVWVIGSHTAAEKEALKACGMGDVEDKPARTEQAGPCAAKGNDTTPAPGDAAKPGETRTTPAQ
jgi:hypothetical protein